MRPQDLDVAAEFCAQVGAPHLVAYLGLDDAADVADVRGKLKARRKYMQGMQGNPKYKKEALLLIKHFQSLNDAVDDLPAYLRDARRRAESEHLPIIEMTIRGVLAGGGLTPEQESYLRHNALELGMTEDTFHDVLERVAGELSVRVSVSRSQSPAPAVLRGEPVDLYALLRIPHHASADEIRAAYARCVSELETGIADEATDRQRKRLAIAQQVLTNEDARRQYDLTASHTGPPSRERRHAPTPGLAPRAALRPDQIATAPPVRERLVEPRSNPPAARVAAPRLELLGEPVRALPAGAGSEAAIIVRNGGDGEMAGVVSTDVPWLAVAPERLDPGAREQQVTVWLDPALVPADAARAVVTIRTDRGEHAQVVFELERDGSRPRVVALLLLLLVFELLLALMLLS